MLRKILPQTFCLHRTQLTELDNLAFVTMVTNFTWKQKKYSFSFAHWIHVPTSSAQVLIVLKIFMIMSSKRRHYTPKT